MKRISIYSVLFAVFLLAGCSQKKEVEVSNDSSNSTVQSNTSSSTSETNLNNIDEPQVNHEVIGVINDMLVNSQENGHFYIINGKKVFIENIYFAFDKYNLDEKMQNTSSNNAFKLSKIKSNTRIKLEGHTDEWGSGEYNQALGVKRAKSVRNSLISEGISGDIIDLVSFGESNPVCTQKTQNCWQKNRRVEHKLTK